MNHPVKVSYTRTEQEYQSLYALMNEKIQRAERERNAIGITLSELQMRVADRLTGIETALAQLRTDDFPAHADDAPTMYSTRGFDELGNVKLAPPTQPKAPEMSLGPLSTEGMRQLIEKLRWAPTVTANDRKQAAAALEAYSVVYRNARRYLVLRDHQCSRRATVPRVLACGTYDGGEGYQPTALDASCDRAINAIEANKSMA